MKNIHVVILSMMVMIVTTEYAVGESQETNIYTIPTKNYEHRYRLDVIYEGSRNGARAIMRVGPLILLAIQIGNHDLARQMRMSSIRAALEHQKMMILLAQESLKEWGYIV
ncbi:MAG TPA: hypothetical protein VHX42_01810 [Candidatus Babeliales bacterium]|jgi:hypothetical protein|nr:hypothetical protein [Candidatus Babeliales bacterium]